MIQPSHLDGSVTFFRIASGRISGPIPFTIQPVGHAKSQSMEARVQEALGELARAVRAGGVLAIDLMTARFAERRDISQVHAKVTDDWAIVTRFSRPAPHRFDRRITVFRRSGDGWRRSDEHHRNVTFEVDDALRVLRDNGIDAHCRAAFGDEKLPEGLVVLTGVRRL